MTQETSRWSKRYVLVGALALIAWQVGILLEVPRRTEILLAVYGFVFHVLFGKAYALVPAYFDRELAVARAPAVQFPLVVLGTASLVAASLDVGPAALSSVGALFWGLGVALFVVALVRTIGGPLLAGETGTGDHNADRRPVDRLSNGFVPVALGYLLVGAYETAALYGGLPTLFAGLPAQTTHLLAAGTATLFVFALGFRLLPRFLVAYPPLWAPWIVLPAGAVAPLLLVSGLVDARFLLAGALLEALAVSLFAAVTLWMLYRSERRRVGFYAVAVAMLSGVAGVSLGLWFALEGLTAATVTLHLRLNLLGFLGLTVVGMIYQFYPPRVGVLPGSTNRTALLSICGLGGALVVHAVVLVAGRPSVIQFGYALALGGALLYGYLVYSAFRRGTSG